MKGRDEFRRVSRPVKPTNCLEGQDSSGSVPLVFMLRDEFINFAEGDCKDE